jgi:lipopolysaccharide biosynthesis glycosyltransferase
MKNKNLICTSFDNNYLWPWMVMVYSAAINSENRNFRIIVANMNHMLSEECINIAKKFIESLGLSIEIVNIETSLNLTFEHQFNLTVYSRLFLMDKLDEDFIWFDADLLLLPGWDQIFVESVEESCDSTVIYGVVDSAVTLQALAKEQNQAYIKTSGRYINSGVVKVKTNKWKKLHKEVDWQVMALNLKKYGLSLPDQDILNYLCADHIALISPGFNYIVGDQISFQEKILIKHFAGSPKPWQLDKAGKEFLLAVQGAKYFSPRDWITQSCDAYLDFPKYWQVEAELLSHVQKIDDGLGQKVAGLRSINYKKLDFVSLIKHYLIQLISRRFLY